MVYSVFEVTHYIHTDLLEHFEWKTEYHFYYGDLSKVNCETDCRFKYIKNKRNLSIYLGMHNGKLPVSLPLTIKLI